MKLLKLEELNEYLHSNAGREVRVVYTHSGSYLINEVVDPEESSNSKLLMEIELETPIVNPYASTVRLVHTIADRLNKDVDRLTKLLTELVGFSSARSEAKRIAEIESTGKPYITVHDVVVEPIGEGVFELTIPGFDKERIHEIRVCSNSTSTYEFLRPRRCLGTEIQVRSALDLTLKGTSFAIQPV